MNIGIKTNLSIASYGGIVSYEENYVAVRFPQARQFFFGNYLVLFKEPNLAELMAAERKFRDVIGAPPDINHIAFSWPALETTSVTQSPFSDLGYAYLAETVLTASTKALVIESTPVPGVVIRELHGDEDWTMWEQMQAHEIHEFSDQAAHISYVSAHKKMYRTLVSEGCGTWWGAFVEGELVSTVGVAFFEEYASFQDVQTIPACRRQGICRALLQTAMNSARTRAAELIIIADEDYFAFSFYKSLGFEPKAKIGNLLKL
jgi:ribosomal protein S18 acetylase RimI-like enzyme